MYERILVPLDGSETAEVAVPRAEELAEMLEADITLLHVCESEDDKNYHMHSLHIEKIAELSKQRAKEKGFKVNPVQLTGHHAEQIVDYADKEDIGLIIMATHGLSGIRRWVLGSVTEKVIRATTKPVIIIRADSDSAAIKKALVPLDGSKESEAVLPYIEELASRLKSEVVLLHAVVPITSAYSMPFEPAAVPLPQEDLSLLKVKAQEYLSEMAVMLNGKGIKTSSRVVFGPAADEIIGVADEINADLVAMSTHGRSGISRWAIGSVADKILRAGNTPVMLVREPGTGTK